MLSELLAHLHNWFIKEIKRGEFVINNGSVNVEGIAEGQYFRIVGSTFNDGLYICPEVMLMDETFNGEIWLLAIPREVIEIANEVADWMRENEQPISSPYQSESFGGYSYSKTSVAGSNGVAHSFGWQDAFRTRLNRWRKLQC